MSDNVDRKAPAPSERRKPSWSPIFGVLALLVVAVAIWQSWGLYAGLPSLLLGDRVAFAFAVDATLFAMLQAFVFAETSGPAWRFVPFFGLAAWLILPEEEGLLFQRLDMLDDFVGAVPEFKISNFVEGLELGLSRHGGTPK
eukprot:Skav205353  [mRNA]  locus=scaffold1956:80298:82146:- [translate_table: standard]